MTVILVITTVTYFAMLLRKAKKLGGAKEEAPPPDQAGEEPRVEKEPRGSRSPYLKRSFLAGFKRLRTQSSGRDARYGIPWMLMMGQAGSRGNELLTNAGLSLPMGPPVDSEMVSELGCRWWFLDNALVLDLAGEYVLREDGETDDTVGWRTFLRLLQRTRPKRPIDGIILTISCKELLEAHRAGPEAAAQIEQKARYLYGKLRDAQRLLGLRFPVYLLITGTERIRGFSAFTEELPDKLKYEMFGWSSPYSVETAYRTSWVDEAFQVIKQDLDHVELEMFARVADIDEPDDVFLFSSEMMVIKEPLRVYLDHLFKPIAYHESMLFRGIYFTGADVAEAGEASGSQARVEEVAVSEGSRISALRRFFLKDLFEQKIFREASLGGPTGASMLQRNRKVRLAWLGLALATVFIGTGFYLANERLAARSAELEPFLEDTYDEIKRSESTAVWSGGADRSRLRLGATRFLNGLTELDASRFGSFFIPPSWLPGFNGNLSGAFVRAYDVIVFRAMRLELENRAASSVQRTQFTGDDRQGGVPGAASSELRIAVPVDETRVFRNLESYVEGLVELEENGEKFNRLQRTRSLEDLSTVVDYLFEEPLPEGFFRNADLYERALRGVEYKKFEVTSYRPDALRRGRDLVDDFYRGLFEENPFGLTLETLSDELASLARQRWTLYDEANRLQYIVDLVDRVDLALSEPALYWIFRERFDLGPEFDRVRGLIDRSAFLRSDIAEVSFGDQLNREAEDRWRLLRRALLDFDGAGLTGPLLKRNQDGPLMQLSEDVEILKTSLEDFLDQSFMATDQLATLPSANVDLTRNRIRWDDNLLSFAVSTHEPYQRFLETGLDYFPAHLQSTLKIVAQKRLNATLIDLVGRSQILEPIPEGLTGTLVAKERELKDEIGRFAEAMPALNRLLTIFQDAQLFESQKALSDLLAEQSHQLLMGVDTILVAEGFYRPRGGSFSWWDVSSPVVEEAFGVKDADELQAYLARQRDRIATLAVELAQPLVTMLDKTGGETHRDVLLRWDRIIDELAGYQEKRPGNSVTALEELISAEMADIGLENCFDVARPLAQGGSTGDFFRDKELFLRDRLYQRCYQVVGERAAAGYEKLARFFNQRLSGKFPFAEAVSEVYPVEADPDSLREFFRIFDAEQKIILGVPEDSPSFRSGGENAHEFVRMMGEVRRFLSVFLDQQSAGGLPVIEFEAEFRVNRQAEIAADQVIDWVLLVGPRTIIHPDPNPQARWTLGDPVHLTLRWAIGSPWLPVEDQRRLAAEVDDGSVIYKYENRWSLVSFLQAHQSSATDFVSLRDERPHTLRFDLLTRRDYEGETSAGTPIESRAMSQARLFIRVSLIDAETKEPVVLPEFPFRAPELGASSAAGRGGG